MSGFELSTVQSGIGYLGSAFAYEPALTIPGASTALTSTIYAPATVADAAPTQGARVAVISVETAALRYRIDGVAAPTASEGHECLPGDQIIISGSTNIANFRAIRETATSATIRATYYR